jgi:hypothetical protein
MIRRNCIVAACLLLASIAFASSKPADKNGTVIDEGAFGIFQNGQRYATETFVVRQYPGSSVTSAQLRSEKIVNTDIAQSSELTLHPDGTLQRYEWKQTVPPHNSATVEVKDQFLSMHYVADGKTVDRPFFLMPDVFVLDDYFFIAREILLWRYMTSSCKPRPGSDSCDLERARFAVLIPRRQISDQVFVEMKGYDDMPFNGRPQHLRHFVIEADGNEWHLWLDSNMKLLRISIPSNNTEILRQER